MILPGETTLADALLHGLPAETGRICPWKRAEDKTRLTDAQVTSKAAQLGLRSDQALWLASTVAEPQLFVGPHGPLTCDAHALPGPRVGTYLSGPCFQ